MRFPCLGCRLGAFVVQVCHWCLVGAVLTGQLSGVAEWRSSHLRSLHRSNADRRRCKKGIHYLLCWSILQASQPFDANAKKKKDNDGQTVKQTKDQVTYRRQHLFRVITYTFAVLSFQSRRGGLCLATHYSFTLAQTSHPKHVAAAVSKSEMRMNKCKEQIGPGGHAFLFPSVISLRRSLAPSIPTSNNATRKTKSNAIMHDLIERHFTRS